MNYSHPPAAASSSNSGARLTSVSGAIASLGAPGKGTPLNMISMRCSPAGIWGRTSLSLLLEVISNWRGWSSTLPVSSPGPASEVSKLILLPGASFSRPSSSQTACQPPAQREGY